MNKKHEQACASEARLYALSGGSPDVIRIMTFAAATGGLMVGDLIKLSRDHGIHLYRSNGTTVPYTDIPELLSGKELPHE